MNTKASIQDIHRKRRIESFQGREDEIASFRRNLLLPFTDRKFIWNIYGQGGVGKSTLLRRYQSIAKEQNAAVALVDESQNSVLDVMNAMTLQFEHEGLKLERFASNYRLYRQLNEQIAMDPDAPTGMSAMVGRVISRVGIATARQVPALGLVIDLAGEDNVVQKVSEYTTYLMRKIGNKDKVRLLLEPTDTLTPLFVSDLADIAGERFVLIGFDTYERTTIYLDRWLYSTFEGKYGDLDPDIITIIAGRHSLDTNWSDYNNLIQAVPLEPFSDAEAENFLVERGINDKTVIELILRLSGNLPLWLATLAAQSPTKSSELDDPTNDAVERFLKWIDDSNQRRTAVVCALPQSINRDLVATLIGEEFSTEMFDWLKGQPFVQQNARRGWVYHDVVRNMIVRHLRNVSYADWTNLNLKLIEYFAQRRDELNLDLRVQTSNDTWLDFEISALFHKICLEGEKSIPYLLDGLLTAFDERLQYAQRWGETTLSCGKLMQIPSLVELGEVMVKGVSGYIEDNFEAALELFNKIQQDLSDCSKLRHVLLSRRGFIFYSLRRYEEALLDFSRAIEMDPAYQWAYSHRGDVYQALGRYEEALADFSRAIELDSADYYSLAGRGETLRLLERLEEALLDFNRAIELDTADAWIIASRGQTFQELEKFEEALSDFNRAVDLDPTLGWILAGRGETLRLLGRFEDALLDFNRAIELDTADAWTIASRGETLQGLERYEEALADFSYAIELSPEYFWAIAERGTIHEKLDRLEEALADFTRAVQLDSSDDWKLFRRGQLLYKLGRYEEALGSLNRAIELNPSETDYYFERGYCYYTVHLSHLSLEDFVRCCNAEPENALYQNNRAFVLLQLGMLEEARKVWYLATELSDAPDYAFAGYAVTLEMLSFTQEATKQYQMAVTMEPRWNDDIVNIAQELFWSFDMVSVAQKLALRLQQ